MAEPARAKDGGAAPAGQGVWRGISYRGFPFGEGPGVGICGYLSAWAAQEGLGVALALLTHDGQGPPGGWAPWGCGLILVHNPLCPLEK